MRPGKTGESCLRIACLLHSWVTTRRRRAPVFVQNAVRTCSKRWASKSFQGNRLDEEEDYGDDWALAHHLVFLLREETAHRDSPHEAQQRQLDEIQAAQRTTTL